MDSDGDETIENRLENMYDSMENFKTDAISLGDALIQEKLWRKGFLTILAFLFVVFIGVTGVVIYLVVQVQNVQEENLAQSKNNFESLAASKELLNQIQACNDPTSECSKRSNILINKALTSIQENNQAQFDKLKNDLQNLIRQLQVGETISKVTTTVAYTSNTQLNNTG